MIDCLGRLSPIHQRGLGGSVLKMPEEAKLHIGNLAFDVREHELRDKFEKYGVVEEVTIIKDKDTGRPRGYAFVMFENVEDSKVAMDALHKVDFGGRYIEVEKAKPCRYDGGGRNSGGGGNRYTSDGRYDNRNDGWNGRRNSDNRGRDYQRDSRYSDRGGGGGYDRDQSRGDRYGGGGYDRDRGDRYGGGGGGYDRDRGDRYGGGGGYGRR